MDSFAECAGDALLIGNKLVEFKFKLGKGFRLERMSDRKTGKAVASQKSQTFAFDRKSVDLAADGALEASLESIGGTEDVYQGPGKRAQVRLTAKLPGGATLSILRELSVYDGAPALRIIDRYSSDKPLAGLLHSDVFAVAFPEAPESCETMNYFSCSDQSNWRLSQSKAEEKSKGFMLLAKSSGGGVFLYKEGPLPDCQPVKTDYEFLCEDGFRSASLVGLGFDRLRPGETRRANGAVLGLIQDGASLLGFKRYQKARYKVDIGSEVEFLANTWPAFHLDVTEEKISGELDRAARTGVKTVFIDDGWFETFMGEIDAKKFPNKFARISEKAKAKGLEIGVWMNPFGLDARNPKAKLWDGAECHDTMTEGNNWNWIARNEDYLPVDTAFSEGVRVYYGMDMMDEGYFAHIRERVASMWRDYGIRRFKFDLYQLSSYDTLLGDKHQHLERYRELLEALKKDIPGLVVSMDVTRKNRPNIDFALDFGRLFMENRGRSLKDHRFYHPYISLRNLWQKSRFAPAQKLELEVMPQIDDYSVAYTLSSALFANPLYWGSLAELDERKAKEVKAFVDWARPHKAKIMEGLIFPFGEAPDKGSWSGMASLNPQFPEKASGYLAVYRNGASSTSWTASVDVLKGRRLALKDAASGESCVYDGKSINVEINEPFGFKLFSFEEA